MRNLLFAPGDSARKAEKALASAADGVILDLEDSVAPPAQGSGTRPTVAALLPALDRPGVVVRVNPLGTPWYLRRPRRGRAGAAGRDHAAEMHRAATTSVALDHHLEALEDRRRARRRTASA